MEMAFSNGQMEIDTKVNILIQRKKAKEHFIGHLGKFSEEDGRTVRNMEKDN